MHHGCSSAASLPLGVALAACADSGALAGPDSARRTTTQQHCGSHRPDHLRCARILENPCSRHQRKGEIVGRYASAGQNHGFLRDASGNLTTVDFPGSSFSVASSINDRGDILGWYTLPTDPTAGMGSCSGTECSPRSIHPDRHSPIRWASTTGERSPADSARSPTACRPDWARFTGSSGRMECSRSSMFPAATRRMRSNRARTARSWVASARVATSCSSC